MRHITPFRNRGSRCGPPCAHFTGRCWVLGKIRECELDAREQAQKQEAAAEVTIEMALLRWLASLQSALENEYTRRKYETTARKIKAWAQDVGIDRLSQVTTDRLDLWKSHWSKKAKRVEDRMGKTTAGRHLEKVKAFFLYCQALGWIRQSPAVNIKAIKGKQVETLPLLDGRYEMVLAATYQYDEGMRLDDRYGAELRALIELMRWTGLRISDALRVSRDRISGNRFPQEPRSPERSWW
jgi:integrase/recombinase XerD